MHDRILKVTQCTTKLLACNFNKKFFPITLHYFELKSLFSQRATIAESLYSSEKIAILLVFNSGYLSGFQDSLPVFSWFSKFFFLDYLNLDKSLLS